MGSWTRLFRRTTITPIRFGGGRGHRGVAAKSRPRTIRGGVSRQRNRRRGPAEANGGGPEGTRRRRSRPSAQDFVGNRGAARFGRRARPGRAATAGRGVARPGASRATPAHGDVLRSGRLDRDVGQARSRGLARDYQRVSPLLRDADRAQRRVRREIHGRWRTRLFWLSPGARTRRRARRASGARDCRGRTEARHPCRLATARAGRDRDGDRGCRRSPGVRRGAGARRRRRHAQSCR